MVRSTVLAVACALLLTAYRPAGVGAANEFADRLADLNRRLAELSEKFYERMQMIFHDQERLSALRNLRGLLAVSSKMAESELILYAFQRRALFVAAEIINSHFVAKTAPLDPALVSAPVLADIIILCTYGRSIEHGMIAIGQHRRGIYLLERMYEREPGVMDLARIYSRSIASTVLREERAKQLFQRALDDYREAVPLRMLRNANEDANTMRAVGTMIKDAERRVDQAHQVTIEQLIRKYVDPKTIIDVKVALQRTLGTIALFTPDMLNAVQMDDIRRHDQAVVQSRLSGVPTHLTYRYAFKDLNKDSFDRFQRRLQKMFYDRQQVASRTENFVLMALSAQMTETEALIYVQELRMLWILDDLFERHSALFDQFLAINRKPFDVLVQRLLNFALEDGLRAIPLHRKRIYLMETRYDQRHGVMELARDYSSEINSLKFRLIKGQFDVDQLTESFRRDSTQPGEADAMLKVIDEMFVLATEKYERSNATMANLLKGFLEPPVYEALRNAKSMSANRYVRPNLAETQKVTDEQIFNYELRLFTDDQRPPAMVPPAGETAEQQ